MSGTVRLIGDRYEVTLNGSPIGYVTRKVHRNVRTWNPGGKTGRGYRTVVTWHADLDEFDTKAEAVAALVRRAEQT